MSIPDTDMHIGDLYDDVLKKYVSGKLLKYGMIMRPEDALQHFKNLAVEEGFAESTIEKRRLNNVARGGSSILY